MLCFPTKLYNKYDTGLYIYCQANLNNNLAGLEKEGSEKLEDSL